MNINEAIKLVESGRDAREVLDEFIMDLTARATSGKPGNPKNEFPKTPSNNMDRPEKTPRMKSQDDLSYGIDPQGDNVKVLPPKDFPVNTQTNDGTDTHMYNNKLKY